jgi:peroxiredoxin
VLRSLPALALTLGGFGAYLLLTLEAALWWQWPWPFVGVSALGVVWALDSARRRRDVGTAVVAVASAAVFASGAWWLAVGSALPAREDRPAVGETFPAFRLPTSEGARYQFRAPRPGATLLLFYRGGWCPFCRAELAELRDRWREIHDRGVEILAVSSEPAERSEALRRKLELPITFLSDTEGVLMDALGIRDAGAMDERPAREDIFLPTTFLVDADGVIRWVFRPGSYRVRAGVARILEAIDAL